MSALSVLAVADVVQHSGGYRQAPSLSLNREAQGASEDRLREEMAWMLPRSTIEARDRELLDGDAWAYDESVQFLGEHWNKSSTSRVVYVASQTEPSSYVDRVVASGAKWVSVWPDSEAEKALVAYGVEEVGLQRMNNSRVYRLRKK